MPRPVVLVHGFTQTARSWDRVVAGLGPGLDPRLVELPGHGASGLAFEPFERTATALGRAGGAAAYVGYSMGGRLCLRLALDRPDLVRALVLVSSTAGIADGEQRRLRRAADAALATELVQLGSTAFLDRWLAQPLFAGTEVPIEELEARRRNSPEDLARALRLLGTGAQEPLWDRLADLDVPTLAVAGAADAKFCSIAHQMARASEGRVEVTVVPATGHALPIEAPGELVELVRNFLEAHDGSSP